MPVKRNRRAKKPQTFKGQPAQAIMEVKIGESIAGMWVSNAVPEIGIYKLIAKEKSDGSCEWAHFVQRESGLKDKVYRGSVDSVEQLSSVVDAINSALSTAYGSVVKLHPAEADVDYVDNLGLANPTDEVH